MGSDWIVKGLKFDEYLGDWRNEVQEEAEESIEYSCQGTLDSWRSYSVLGERLEEADSQLRNEYGSGIDFALVYGTTTTGLTMFPDSVLSRKHEAGDPWFDESDIDVIVGLENLSEEKDPKLYRQDAASLIYQNYRPMDIDPKYPEAKIHPLVHKSDFLTDTFAKARNDWIEEGGSKELIRLKGQPKDGEIYSHGQLWHNFMRGFMKGFAFPREFYSPEFHVEIEKGVDEILDQEGNLRNDIDFEVDSIASYVGDNRPNRADRLNRNYLYGKWENAKRRHRIVHEDLIGDNAEVEIPLKQAIWSIALEEIGENELSAIVDRNLKNSGQWRENLSEKEFSAKNERIKSALTSNIEVFNDLVHPEFINDIHFSRHNNVSSNMDVEQVRGDYEGIVELMFRGGSNGEGYYEGFELDMASNLVNKMIKQKYDELNSLGIELTDESGEKLEKHEVKLNQLLEKEANAKWGSQSEITDF